MKKNYEKYVLYGLLAIVVIGAVFAFTGFAGGTSKNKLNPNVANSLKADPPSSFKSIMTGDTSSGSVSVELTPSVVSNGQLKVKISINTHSVSLDQFDLKQITTLEHDGKLIKPASAPGLGCYHFSGELVFNVNKEINSFTIRIKGIPLVEERVFNW